MHYQMTLMTENTLSL